MDGMSEQGCMEATGGVERVDAEASYDAGREAMVVVLLAMDRRVGQLEERVEKLEPQLARSPCNSLLPPNSDPPGKRLARAKSQLRTPRVASRAPSPVTRATAVSYCRPARWMRWWSTGRWAVRAVTPSPSGWWRMGRCAGRSRSCRRSP